MSQQLVVMGYAGPEPLSRTRSRMAELASRLTELADVEVGITPLPTYNDLTQRLARGELDLAWLSPVPVISLAQNGRAVPIVSLHRDRLVHYRCAIIVPATKPIANLAALRGLRAAWVDQHSAAGYILPRIELAAHGMGQGDLGAERFLGSHDAVVRAVASGQADFGATYARIARNGEVTGPWTPTPGLAASITVVTTFGEIPPDAIVVRPDLDVSLRGGLAQAFVRLTETDADRSLVADALGADAFRLFEPTMYDAFRATVFRAFQQGLLDDSTVEEVKLFGVDATIEHRPGVPLDVPTAPTLPKTESTQEADVIEVIDAAKKL